MNNYRANQARLSRNSRGRTAVIGTARPTRERMVGILGNAVSDLPQRLRDKANDLYSAEGETMKRWGEIRHQVETRRGSDLPRMNFESLIEELADLLVEAAEALDPSQLHNLRNRISMPRITTMAPAAALADMPDDESVDAS